MVSRFVRFIGPAAMVVSLAAFLGCAGSKNSSSADYSSMDSQGASKTAKLDDARRSAEEAEAKAHQLREEKARNQSKTSSN